MSYLFTVIPAHYGWNIFWRNVLLPHTHAWVDLAHHGDDVLALGNPKNHVDPTQNQLLVWTVCVCCFVLLLIRFYTQYLTLPYSRCVLACERLHPFTLFIAHFVLFSHLLFLFIIPVSPWYDLRGWLGVKNQLSIYHSSGSHLCLTMTTLKSLPEEESFFDETKTLLYH